MTDNHDPHPSTSTTLSFDSASNGTSNSEDDSTLPTLPQSQPEDDGEKDPKNKKRKRTSPEDHNILEHEYMRNPKPDKAARVEIVKKVKLSEKEVQIWFQNKRQSTRRKSRPLLPHEIASLGLGGTVMLSSDSISSSLSDSSQPMYPQEEQLRSDVSIARNLEGNQEQVEDAAHEEQSVIKSEIPPPAANIELPIPQTTRPVAEVPSLGNVIKIEEHESNTIDETPEPKVGPSSTGDPVIIPPSSNPHLKAPVSCPKKDDLLKDSNGPSSSRMRLSLSLEGRAELQKISPPRAPAVRPLSNLSSGPRRPHGLQRSRSALPLGFGSTKSSASARAPRLTTGRSRDARAWEFYADNGTRNELAFPVDHHEPSGSAVAAIGLIRSASNNALSVNHAKRNATPSRAEDNKATKKPKLSRASSSLARLQGIHHADIVKPGNDKQPSRFANSPTGDSDKENRMPGENGMKNFTGKAVQAPKLARQRVLGESGNMQKSTAQAGVRRNRKKKPSDKDPIIFEDKMPEKQVDPEVERFMRGEMSPSKRGDLDCVQGLLSLSQGNWR